MSNSSIKTTQTVFGIIQALVRLDEPTISEIADQIDRAPSTVHDHLTTLHEMEYVRREGNQFLLGLKFLDHGIYAKEQLALTEALNPSLKQLAEDTGESAWVIVEEHGRGVNLEGETGERGVRTRDRTGWRTYLHVHAAGKTILAYLPEERVREIIDKWGLPRLTPQTITDEDELFAELERIRERGYGTDSSEGIEGLRAVAAPIVVDGAVHGSVTVAAPANRIEGVKFEQELPDAVRGAANAIELKLTYQ